MSDHADTSSLFTGPRSAEARRIIDALQSAGFVAYLAGGCVRDALLQLTPKDFDVATNATPQAVRELFGNRRTLAYGSSFGVIGVLPERPRDRPTAGARREPTEVATFRSDGTYSDGRRPDAVHFGNAEQDALRRDFTINGMFYDPSCGDVIDHVGGQADLAARLLRTIGVAEQRFEEDKLRLLRAVRFATTLGFQLDPVTDAAIQACAAGIQVVSGERIGAELRRLLVAPRAAHGLSLLLTSGLHEFVWPGLDELDLELIGKRFDHLAHVDFPSSLACALLAAESPRAMLTNLTQRWRLANEEQRAIRAVLAGWQTLSKADQIAWSEVQPLLVDRDAATMVNVAEAALRAQSTDKSSGEAASEAIKLVREALAWAPRKLDPAPLLTGADLQRLAIKPGPIYREILVQVRDAQLNGQLATTEQAIALAVAIAQADD